MKSTKYGIRIRLLKLVSWALLVSATCGAEGLELWEDGEARLKLDGELTGRVESWNWFGEAGSDYGYGFARTRVRLTGDLGWMGFRLEPQYVQMWELPEMAQAVGKGPSGMGGLYFAHNRETSPGSVGLHVASVQFKGLPLGGELEVGRMVYASGLEGLRAEDGVKFNALKTMRLGDRLISSFEWSAFARAFDGVRIKAEAPGGVRVSAGWFKPTQGGWEKDFNDRIEDLELGALEVTVAKGSFWQNAEMGAFAYQYNDKRAVSQRVDNSGRTAGFADIEVLAVGGHLVGVEPLEGWQWDYLVWGVYETGDWYEQNHAAYAYALESGVQWMDKPLKPWLRVGYFMGSGDADSKDDSHKTFFQLIPGTRKYQLFPYYNLQNNESLYGQLILTPSSHWKIRLDYAVNRLAESADLWYMGTGATQAEGNIFGYIGRPSGGQTGLSREVSLTLDYQFGANLHLQLFYAHVWGDDVISFVYPDARHADLCTFELEFKF